MERILLVAGSQKGQDILRTCLAGCAFDDICCVRTGGDAWRTLTDQSFSLVVVLSPLPDGTGYDIAQMAAKTTAGVLLLAKAETAQSITEPMIEAGILVVPVPLNRRAFGEAVNMMRVVHRRLAAAVPQTERLQQKIREIRLVDRAKCLLIQYEKMTEEEAHRYMEQEAMNRRVTRVNIAEEILQSYSG